MRLWNRIKKVNILLLILALLTSFILWAYVMVTNDPEREKTVTGIIPEYIGEDGVFSSRELMLISQRNRPLTLTFRGRTADLNKLDASTVKITVDLSNVTAQGVYSLSYDVILPSTASNVLTIRKDDYITVNIDRRISKPIEIRVDANVKVVEGYMRKSNELAPSTILVTGASSVIDTIKEALVTYDRAEPLSAKLSLSMPYTFVDNFGNVVAREHITVDVETVSLVIPVVKYKRIPLSLEFIDGGGLLHAKNINYNIEPKEILVTGDEAFLEAYNSISIGTIDLNNLLESSELTFDIVLPNGMVSEAGITSAIAAIEIIGVTTRVFTVTVKAKNYTPPAGYFLDILTRQIDIVLRGSPEILDAISATNISAYVNLENITLSSNIPQEFPVDIELNINAHIGILTKKNALVELKEETSDNSSSH